MYLFTFLAVPTPDAKEFHEAGGAYVNCWILGDDRSDRDAAEERARELIEEYGWDIEALEEGAIVSSADHPQDDEDRVFYEQALVEREVLVFNTWPRGDEDGGD